MLKRRSASRTPSADQKAIHRDRGGGTQCSLLPVPEIHRIRPRRDKTVIEAGKIEKLVPTLKVVREAVLAGEFDAAIQAVRPPKRRSAKAA
jgi:hypothetical protein